MTDRMEEIGDRLEAAACVYPATIDGHAALFNAIGERDEHAADDLVFLCERCASLEALVRELESGCKAACGYLLNAKIDLETGAPKRTAISTIEGGLKTVRAALSHPIVSELTGDKG